MLDTLRAEVERRRQGELERRLAKLKKQQEYEEKRAATLASVDAILRHFNGEGEFVFAVQVEEDGTRCVRHDGTRVANVTVDSSIGSIKIEIVGLGQTYSTVARFGEDMVSILAAYLCKKSPVPRDATITLP